MVVARMSLCAHGCINGRAGISMESDLMPQGKCRLERMRGYMVVAKMRSFARG